MLKKRKIQLLNNFFYKYKFDKVTDLTSFIKKWDELTEYHYAFYTKKLISYAEQRKRRMEDLFDFYKVKTNKDGIKLYDEYLVFFEKNWCLYQDVIPTLKFLKDNGFILGIISNGDIDQQIQKCKNTNIFNYFDYINSSSQFTVSKPNPEIYKQVFSMHNIALDDILYIGNSYSKDYLPCKEL